MRDNPLMRCIANIVNNVGIADIVQAAAERSGCVVVYHPEAAVLDDLDYVDRVTAYNEGYDVETYRYHCGSLWARREQRLDNFWTAIYQEATVPAIFSEHTISDERWD